MRKNSAQTAQIVDFIYAKTDAPSPPAELISSASAHNITEYEAGIIDAKNSQFAYTNSADQIQIVQGTPNSEALYNVDPFGTGYPDVEKSGILKKGNVLSVAKYEYALPTYQVTQLSGISGENDDTTYQLVVTMQSVRGDITYGMNKEVFSVSYDKSLASPTQAILLKHFATELNKFSSIVGTVAGQGGTKPFMVLALETTTTESDSIGSLVVGDTIPVGTYNGTAVTYTVDKNLLHTLNKAILDDTSLHDAIGAFTTGYKVVDGTTATSISRLLFVALDETPLLAFDDIMEVKTRVDFGINDLTYTKTELVPAFEGTGLGRQVVLWYRQKAKLQKFNMQNHPVHGEFFINQDLPEYFTTDGKYSLTVIDYFDTVDTINGTSTHPKQVVIVHDAAETVGADVAAGVTVATTATANFENQLSAWITSANDSYKAIKFLGTATKAVTTFG